MDPGVGVLSAGVDSTTIDLDGFSRMKTFLTPLGTTLALDTSVPAASWDTPSQQIDSAIFDSPLSGDFNDRWIDETYPPTQAECWPKDNVHGGPFKMDWESRRHKATSLDLSSPKSTNGSTDNNTEGAVPSPTSPTTRQPRRRNGRRSAAASNASSSGDSQNRNRERFLERNRIAAAKCRQRKKEWTGNLEARARKLTKENSLLQHIVDAQRGEIMALKGAVLEHAQCGNLDIEKFFRYDPSQRLADQHVKLEGELGIEHTSPTLSHTDL